MKKLLSKLGTVGIVLYWIISATLFVMPLVILNAPWWVPILLFLIIFWIPFSVGPIEWVVYIAALLKAVVEPFDWTALLFYISLAIYTALSVVPLILTGPSTLYNNVKNYNEDEGFPMKKLLTKPYLYSLVAVVVAACVGLGVGFWLPPNSSDVTAAYESGVAEGQSAAAEDYSRQLEEEHSAAEASLQSALSAKEDEFSDALQSAERHASSQAYQ